MLPRTKDPEFATPKARKHEAQQTSTGRKRQKHRQKERQTERKDEREVIQKQNCKRANTVT